MYKFGGEELKNATQKEQEATFLEREQKNTTEQSEKFDQIQIGNLVTVKENGELVQYSVSSKDPVTQKIHITKKLEGSNAEYSQSFSPDEIIDFYNSQNTQ